MISVSKKITKRLKFNMNNKKGCRHVGFPSGPPP